MKKLIKRLEELAVENERLSTENSELRKELLQEVRNKVSNELDKDEEIIRHPFTVVVEVAKDFANKIQEVSDALKINDSQDNKKEENKELEEAIEILKDWRFGKCSYSSDEIDRAIETILKHLKK